MKVKSGTFFDLNNTLSTELSHDKVFIAARLSVSKENAFTYVYYFGEQNLALK